MNYSSVGGYPPQQVYNQYGSNNPYGAPQPYQTSVQNQYGPAFGGYPGQPGVQQYPNQQGGNTIYRQIPGPTIDLNAIIMPLINQMMSVVQGFLARFAGGQPGGYPGGQPGGYPGGQPGGYPGGIAGLPGGFPGGIPGGLPGGIPGGFPGGLPGGLPGGIDPNAWLAGLGGLPGGLPGGIGNTPVDPNQLLGGIGGSDQQLAALLAAFTGNGEVSQPVSQPTTNTGFNLEQALASFLDTTVTANA